MSIYFQWSENVLRQIAIDRAKIYNKFDQVRIVFPARNMSELFCQLEFY